MDAKNVVRLIAFLAALGALAVAGFLAVSFLDTLDSGGSLSLCGLTSPDSGLLIGAYLDANADRLEQPAGSDDTPVTFVVEPGETAVDIAARLEAQGLVSDSELFRRYVQHHGLDAGIEAGEFTLRQTMTIPEVALALQEGQRPEHVVTIQEGLRLEQVAEAVAAQTNIPAAEFLALVTAGWRDLMLPHTFLAQIPEDATLEGYLFPDTYRMAEQATALDMLSRMLSTFDQRVTREMRASAANHGMTAHQMIILASIVEREAVLDDERPTIAGVYQNRLEDGWYLNADPTVQYPIGQPGNWWPVLSLADLEYDSPYNTYTHLGLPPGPICSPGLASIRATAAPEETPYFYFMADCVNNDGSHLFAVTQEEHNANYAICAE